MFIAPASAAQLEDLLHLPRVVVDAGHQRRDQDPARDPGPVQLGHRFDPRPRVRRVRLGLARQAFSSIVGIDRFAANPATAGSP